MYRQIFSKRENKVLDGIIQRVADGAIIPFDPANTDYQAYLQWIAEGNEPLPAEE